MSQAKNRSWSITVYPLKYEDASPEAIEEAESGWLHELEHGPIPFGDPMVFLYGCMERGRKGKKLHCHYHVYFKNQVRYSTIQKIFGTSIKIQRTRKAESWEAYIRKEGEFANKADTHIAGPWTYGEKPAPGKPKAAWAEIKEMVKANASNAQILEAHPFAATQMRAIGVLRETFSQPPQIPFETPYAYQREVLDLCTAEPVHRRWIWVYSKEYGTGKTQLGVALCATTPTLIASRRDPRSTLLMFRPEHHRVICFDLPRLFHLTEDFLNFLEELSDQKYLVSDKYESSQKFVKAHIVILTNRSPPLERFGDRIKAIEANKVF